jgi:hypothetical protein
VQGIVSLNLAISPFDNFAAQPQPLFSPIPSLRTALWDFSKFRPILWDLWENRGWGYMPGRIIFLDNFSDDYSRQNLQVTWAYFVDSIAPQKILGITSNGVNIVSVNKALQGATRRKSGD